MGPQKAVKKLYLLRHGDTGLPGRYIGSTDVPMDESGKEQVRHTGRLLQKNNITQILCSPMLRCRQTLEQLDITTDCRFNELLKEIDFGRWEGKTFAEILQSDQKLVDSWVTDPANFTFPDGESHSAFRNRIVSIKSQLEKIVEDNILVITHGGIIRNLLCLLLDIDFDKYLVFDVQPGCFCSIHLHSQGGVLTGFNIKG
jgi:broad specificity phosphatase PhoE